MQIKLKINNLVLNDWESNSVGNWLRRVIDGKEDSDAVLLMQSFHIHKDKSENIVYWCPFFFGKTYFVSDLMKASNPKFYYGVNDLELAKKEVDRFLLRVDKLFIFT